MKGTIRNSELKKVICRDYDFPPLLPSRLRPVRIEEDAVGRQVQTQNPRPGNGPPRHRAKPQETCTILPSLVAFNSQFLGF